jgi:hypothetical protein
MSVDSECKPRISVIGYEMNKISFTNRGIFKNPICIAAGGYKDLAMLLHGFSAAVVERIFPEKQYMEVSPIGSMQHILYHALERDDFFNHDEDYDQIKNTTIFSRETCNNIIKIPALTAFYLNKSAENKIIADENDNQQSPLSPNLSSAS